MVVPPPADHVGAVEYAAPVSSTVPRAATRVQAAGAVEYAPTVPPQRRQVEAQLLRIPGVVGVGEGRNAVGDPAWIAYLSDPGARSTLPARIEGREVMLEITGPIDIRPAR